ncbi:MAG: alpha/beta fold hydrolase [Pseudomonadota bacterium]
MKRGGFEPFDAGHLDVGDGHEIYYEQCGSRDGFPIVYLHGGPGSGCGDGHRRLLLTVPGYETSVRAILFDQRGCGRSRPYCADDLAGLQSNTLAHLVGDLDALRRHLGIARWGLCGGSWGTTLALNAALNAARNAALNTASGSVLAARETVSFIVLAGIALTRRCEIDWLFHDLRHVLPEAFQAFSRFAPAATDGVAQARAHYEALVGSDITLAHEAAQSWCDWEAAVAHVDPRSIRSTRWDDPRFRLGFARMVTQYFHQVDDAYDATILKRLNRLSGLPVSLIQSRLDLDTPLKTAFEVHHAIEGSDLILMDGALHSSTEGAVADRVRSELARRLDALV